MMVSGYKPMPIVGSLEFGQSFPLGLAIALLVLLGVFSLLVYLRENIKYPGVRWLLLLLRLCVLGWLLFLILKPLWVEQETVKTPRPIVLLIDNSKSMQQQDQRTTNEDRLRVNIAFSNWPAEAVKAPARPSRQELVKQALGGQKLELLKKLSEKGPVQAYLFGRSSRRLSEEDLGKFALGGSDQSPYKANEPETRLFDAILERVRQESTDTPAAIVVLTDGRDIGSSASLEEAAKECQARGVPLYVYGVGCSTLESLQVKEVIAPEIVFVKDTAAVRVRWRAQGINKGEFNVQLSLNGQLIDEKGVPVIEGLEDYEYEFKFVPRKDQVTSGSGEFVATVTLDRKEDTLTDSLSRAVRIADDKVKVLYLEGQPRFEYKFLRNVLLRDRRVDLTVFQTDADPEVTRVKPYIREFPDRKDLFAYNMIILGDFPREAMGENGPELIREFVEKGGGLILLAGRLHAPAEYVNTKLSEALPVECQEIKFVADPGLKPTAFLPRRTLQGERSEMLSLADDPKLNAQYWQELPPIFWHYPVTRLRPGATALLVHPTATLENGAPMPIIAMQYYGRGLSVFWGMEETWAWRQNKEDEFYARLWGQLIYRIGLSGISNNRRAQLALDTVDPVVGQTSRLYARLFDSDFEPLKAPEVTAVLVQTDAKTGQEKTQTVLLKPIPDRPGEYSLDLPHDQPGSFTVRLPDFAESEGKAVVPGISYRVSYPPDSELLPTPMAEEELRRLVRLARGFTRGPEGGKLGDWLFREEDLYQLPASIEPQETISERRKETVLWNYWTLSIFVGLIALEWVGRRLANLT
jgi:uncharacterized membrane protein